MKCDLSPLRHVVLDMDGTIYLGGTLFPHTLSFLETLRGLDVGFTFFTNNNSHSRADYVEHLGKLGIEVGPESVLTSCHATVQYLDEHLPTAKELFVLGTEGLCQDLRIAGFRIVDEFPQAVVVGFDRTLTYPKLCQAAYWISQGLPYIATHPDRLCPTDVETLLPDCGALSALLESATGRSPDAVPGKPDPALLHLVLQQYGLQPSEVALVGDRLHTDIQMARRAGVQAVLTLSGESTRSQAEQLPENRRPTLVVENLGEFSEIILAERATSLNPRSAASGRGD